MFKSLFGNHMQQEYFNKLCYDVRQRIIKIVSKMSPILIRD